MNRTNRRTFLMRAAAVTGSVFATAQSYSQADVSKVEESEPQAVALGYKHDTTKVDAKKYPNHAVTQHCANCQLFQGKATDAWGGCPLYGGKQVAARGWCTAWVKKS